MICIGIYQVWGEFLQAKTGYGINNIEQIWNVVIFGTLYNKKEFQWKIFVLGITVFFNFF